MYFYWPRFLLFAWNIAAPFLALWRGWQGHWALALGLLLSAHAWLLAGIFLPRLGLLGPARMARPLRQQAITLTIDDGPHGTDTPQVLEILDRFAVKATFYLIGARAEALPELTREIARRGHRIGNHTWSHPVGSFWRAGPRRIVREISRCQEVLTRLTGLAPTMFRPPAGFVSPFLHPYLQRNHLGVPVLWTVRGFDGKDNDPARILRRLEAGLRPGAVVLIHEAQQHVTPDGQRLAPIILQGVLERAAAKQLRWE